MLHENRTWAAQKVGSAEELAEKLTGATWCGCTGFELDGYWFLNDSTSPDGAAEFGVVKIAGPERKPVQVESITFGWTTPEDAVKHIREAVAGVFDDGQFAHPVDVRVERPERHGRCSLCA